MGLTGFRVAVVSGDDVLDEMRRVDPLVWETGAPVSTGEQPVSAIAYLGPDSVTEASAPGADG